MSFPRYPAYKDSGVEWLGSVPEHWRVDRLRASITSCRNGIWGDEAQDDENDIPCVRVADFDRQKLHVRLQQPTIRNVTEKERAHRLLKRGDLLLEKSGGGENQPVGCVVLYDDDQPAVCSNFVAKVEMAPSMDSSYWRYVHAAAYAVRLTIGSINQTSGIQNLDQDRYFNERAVFPPEQEQTAIGAFLDRETTKIDTLVAEQEQLITLLKEKRQAVISHAVTKGLDPSVPMKDSGVEWLGEVPAHWEVTHLKRRCAVITDGAHISPETEGGVHLFVSTKDISDDGIDFDSALRTSPASYEYMIKTGCQPIGGDVLFSKDGTIGRTVVVNGSIEFVIASSLIIIRPIPDQLNSDFLNALCQSWVVSQQVDGFVKGAGLPRLSIQNLLKVVGVFPPIDEQVQIANYLSDLDMRSRTLALEAERTVALLKERRSALISAAVTGQIDVRGLPPAQEQAA